jgi:hypothetical protein
MSQLFLDPSAPDIDQLQQYLVKALSSIGVQCQFQYQPGSTLLLFTGSLEYSVEWKYRRYYLSQRRGINWQFLLDDAAPIEFAAAVALRIANEKIEATLYGR